MTRDPRVVSLTYELQRNDRVEFVQPPPLHWSNSVADFELRDGILKCVLKQDYSTEVEAKLAVKPALREWGALAELEGHPFPLTFQFQRAEIKQPDPPAAGEDVTVALNARATAMAGGQGTLTIKRLLHVYPSAPTEFTLAEPVEEMWQRYQACEAGHAKPAHAYAALTLVEGLVPQGKKEKKTRRQRAAQLLHIEDGVLEMWGELSTNRGQGTEKRKADGQQRPFTQQEADWLLAVMRRAALQVGRYKAGAPLAPVRMSDLPSL